ncbi:MAG: L,D-transpeptidase, partial [Pyrinomonadaceae bacterium]|nr:L,D-transpeptidase [Pyrinomonadaceae bacterium]
MRSLSRLAGAFCALALTFCIAGCVTQPTNTNNSTNSTTTNTTTNTAPETAKTNATAADDPAVTLPLLDAFFHDETFANELKTKLQLTDEQIERLRKTSREETGKLRETDADDYSGTTSAARARAAEQIKAIIGEDKTRQLTTFIRDRWSGANNGDASNASTTNATDASGSNAAHASKGKPNAVPTDTRIVVNAPAYRMDVFEGGRLVKSYKIGIGYPEFPLPVGQRRANTIIFNPTWTPPDEPWVEASNKVKPGEKIEAGSKLNPLGPIKIPIGLPSLIHGGKSTAKLGGFASHGCVGLTTPQVQEFARMLAGLAGTELTDEQIMAHAKTPKETKEVKLARAVPVELRYETIVVEDGKLHVYRDVYDRGTNTEE